MRNGKGKLIMGIMAAMLSVLSLLGLSGCERLAPGPAPTSGGVTDRTDPDAPKVIGSKEISDYYATFRPAGEWAPGHGNAFYTFEVKPDAAGVLTATESVTGAGAPADGALLDALQAVIDEYRLAEKNGVYRLTAGIDPSEFGPSTLTVHYASGETLTFTVNNDPYEQWTRETYLAFAKWFAEQGDESLLPPGLGKMVTDVRVTVRDGDSSWFYGFNGAPDEDGNRVFVRILDGRRESVPVRDLPLFFDGLSAQIEDFDLSRYDAASPLYGYEKTPEDKQDPYSAAVQLVIKYENGHEVNVRSSAESVREDLADLIFVLFDYFDGQFPAS